MRQYSPSIGREFRRSLLAWFDKQQRDLPWRRTKDPYAIWVSEVMLQQTRVAAVIPYYEKFLRTFPDYKTLAVADDDTLFSHWSGLGYYSRARKLREAAVLMAALGKFPDEFGSILLLPGVGPYTAAAVASIAFGLPHAAVDGNVVRVLSRLSAAKLSQDGLTELAKKLLDRKRPGDFNQAMMELGATVCLPKNPQCLLCPVAEMCEARRLGVQEEFPAKKTKQRNVEIERTLFWVEHDGKVLAWQRPADARLMPGFWELPEQDQLPDPTPGRELGEFRHGITVHNYRIRVCTAEIPPHIGECQWLEICKLAHMPISTIFKKALKINENLQKSPRVLSTSVGN